MLVSISSFASAISGLVDASKHTGEPTPQLTSASDVIAPGDPARMAGCFLLTVYTLLLLFETGAP